MLGRSAPQTRLSRPLGLTRRALLTSLLGAAVAACRPRRRAPTPTRLDGTALTAALDAERQLLAAVDAALAASDAVAAGPLTAARDRHAAHLRALQARVHRHANPTSSPPVVVPPAPPDDLPQRLAASAASLTAAAVAARAGTNAALLASIAAAHNAEAQLPTTRVAG